MKYIVVIVVMAVAALGLALFGPGGSPPEARPVVLRDLQPGTVKFNELLPNPVGVDTGNEWIELANASAQPVDATGLTVVRASGTVVATIPSGTIVPGNGVLVLRSLSGSLINTGDTLRLLSGTTELDRVTYDGTGAEGSSWSNVGGTWSWTLVPTPGQANLPVSQPSAFPTPSPLPSPSPSVQPSAIPMPSPSPSPAASPLVSPSPSSTPAPSPTPAIMPSPLPSPSAVPVAPATTPPTVIVATPTPSPSPTPSPTPTVLQGEILINELMPNPSGDDAGHEWVEFYNPTGQPIDASGWQLKRPSGSVLLTIPASSQVAPQEFLVLPTSGSLVNSGDTVTLWAKTVPVDSVAYDGNGPEGWSWARVDAVSGAWTNTPTPGAPNLITDLVAAVADPTPEIAPAIKAATTAIRPTSTPKAASTKSSATKSGTTKKATALPKSGMTAGSYGLPILLLAILRWWYKRSRRT